MRDHGFAPGHRVAGVLARAVEQLAEEHVEIAQKGLQAVGIGKRYPQVAPVLAGPDLEGESLGFGQPRSQRLRGLDELMGHGAYGHEIQILCQAHVAGTAQAVGNLTGEGCDYLVLPRTREAPSGAEIGEYKTCGPIQRPDLLDLLDQSPASLGEIRVRIMVARVQLADDRQ